MPFPTDFPPTLLPIEGGKTSTMKVDVPAPPRGDVVLVPFKLGPVVLRHCLQIVNVNHEKPGFFEPNPHVRLRVRFPKGAC